MGQRSQIYVRLKDKEGNKYLIAKYFQWNYGERMISRAKYGIEYCKNQIDYIGCIESVREQIRRIFDINFDMVDVLISSNIIEEYYDWKKYKKEMTFNEFTFKMQDNNDGKLFVDIDEATKTIKYCLTDCDLKIFNSPKAYMDWDFENWTSGEYLSKKVINKCISNMNYIEKNATLMTEEELNNFINDDYTDFLEKLNEKNRNGGEKVCMI